MTITETMLIFVVIPAATVGLLALLVFGAGARRMPRYRPGRPFAFSPVWFLASPPASAPAERPALSSSRHRAALPSADSPAATKKGGARGTW
jgi:hypothetical protein